MSCYCGRCEVKPRSTRVAEVVPVGAGDGFGGSVDLVLVSACRVCGGEFSRPLPMGAGLMREVLRVNAEERRAQRGQVAQGRNLAMVPR